MLHRCASIMLRVVYISKRKSIKPDECCLHLETVASARRLKPGVFKHTVAATQGGVVGRLVRHTCRSRNSKTRSPLCDAAKRVCWLRVSSVRIICFVHLKVLTHRRNSRLGIAPDNRRCHCHISVAEHVTQTLYMLAGHKYARQLRV